MSGISDKAQNEDSLDISAYYKGLAGFIERCETPMSIAIQGEWGSGKTSIMNFIKGDLKEYKKIIKLSILTHGSILSLI